MDNEATTAKLADGRAVRVAIQGCGHGALHAMYASLETACKARNWSEVDLLIVCGDFQAVRNKGDLNVTAMPAKYREMMDFHEYYSGARQAPCLTIFIGGNHEASNHLFELYYGGWVAPNIYYMGAANVLRVGPLRIAALSGIWKAYDYRKPHFERLPYSSDDYYGIYHVREIDVRKLLNIRTQVDIGVSHDWPRGVEWNGDSEKLFREKRGFREDAEIGKLGSVAARQCLDRLRPSHWFSAHLHVKFPAIVEHGDYEPIRAQKPVETQPIPSYGQSLNGERQTKDTAGSEHPNRGRVAEGGNNATVERRNNVSAWNNFGATVAKRDAEDAKLSLEEKMKKYQKGPENHQPTYTFKETWKPVKTDDELGREVQPSHTSTFRPGESRIVPQLDGQCCSKSEESPEPQRNPDELEINVDTDESPSSPDHTVPQAVTAPNGLNTNAPSGDLERMNENEIEVDASSEDGESRKDGPHQTVPQSTTRPDPKNPPASDITEGEDVFKSVRDELTAISRDFAPRQEAVVADGLTLPDAIRNTTTDFLALSKIVPHRAQNHFMQLLEITPISDQQSSPVQRPFRLEYDKEWLAITRVFARELELGGAPGDSVPPNLGEVHYKERLAEEGTWVEDNIVQKYLLQIPENFSVVAPVYDPSEEVNTKAMPREYPNPQTDAFCRLIGIENKFSISEEEQDIRVSRGVRSAGEGGRDRRGGRGRFDGRGRGGRGGRGGGNRGRGDFGQKRGHLAW